MKWKNFVLSLSALGTIALPMSIVIACSDKGYVNQGDCQDKTLEDEAKDNIKDIESLEDGNGDDHGYTDEPISSSSLIELILNKENVAKYVTFESEWDNYKQSRAVFKNDQAKKDGYQIIFKKYLKKSDNNVLYENRWIEKGDVLTIEISAEDEYFLSGDYQFEIQAQEILINFPERIFEEEIINKMIEYPKNKSQEFYSFKSFAKKEDNGFELNFVSAVDADGKTVSKNSLQVGNIVTIWIDFEDGYKFKNSELFDKNNQFETKIPNLEKFLFLTVQDVEKFITFETRNIEQGAKAVFDNDTAAKAGYTLSFYWSEDNNSQENKNLKLGTKIKVLIIPNDGYKIKEPSIEWGNGIVEMDNIEVSNILLAYEKQDIINMITINDDDEFASTATKAKNGFELNFVSVVDGEGKTVIKNYLQAGNTVTVEVDFEIGYTFKDNTLLSGDDNNEVKITLQ